MAAEAFIRTPASRRQRDVAAWPQEGRFNNGAWKEAQEPSDGRKGGHESIDINTSIFYSPPKVPPHYNQSTGVRHQLAQHVKRKVVNKNQVLVPFRLRKKKKEGGNPRPASPPRIAPAPHCLPSHTHAACPVG